MIRTDTWPFLKAKYFKDVGATRNIRVIVIHDMEADEKLDTAEKIAQYFHTMPDGRLASAHVCVDADSVIQCVWSRQVAYAAPGCNNDGIHIELAGYGNQTRGQWLDFYSTRTLKRAANVAAQFALQEGVPIQKLTDEQLEQGLKGIVGHDQVSRVYRKSDHTDPGPNFPWDQFMTWTAEEYTERKGV